jgi:hypothetical protein
MSLREASRCGDTHMMELLLAWSPHVSLLGTAVVTAAQHHQARALALLLGHPLAPTLSIRVYDEALEGATHNNGCLIRELLLMDGPRPPPPAGHGRREAHENDDDDDDRDPSLNVREVVRMLLAAGTSRRYRGIALLNIATSRHGSHKVARMLLAAAHGVSVRDRCRALCEAAQRNRIKVVRELLRAVPTAREVGTALITVAWTWRENNRDTKMATMLLRPLLSIDGRAYVTEAIRGAKHDSHVTLLLKEALL